MVTAYKQSNDFKKKPVRRTVNVKSYVSLEMRDKQQTSDRLRKTSDGRDVGQKMAEFLTVLFLD